MRKSLILFNFFFVCCIVINAQQPHQLTLMPPSHVEKPEFRKQYSDGLTTINLRFPLFLERDGRTFKVSVSAGFFFQGQDPFDVPKEYSLKLSVLCHDEEILKQTDLPMCVDGDCRRYELKGGEMCVGGPLREKVSKWAFVPASEFARISGGQDISFEIDGEQVVLDENRRRVFRGFAEYISNKPRSNHAMNPTAFQRAF